MNHFDCKDALPLIGAYTDGELSEVQAGPLRQHLMSCHACRNSAQASKVSRRWFQQPEAELSVPAGFAARVTRLAFAGETGEHAPESLGHLELVSSSASSAPSAPGAAGKSGSGPRSTRTDSRSQLGFLLEVTGIAAAVLVALTVAFRMREVPSGEVLRAGEALSVQEIQERLSELNEVAPQSSTPAAAQSSLRSE